MNILQRIANRSRDLLFFPFMLKYWRQKLEGKVMCLLYHRVDAPGRFLFLDQAGSPVITPEELEFDLTYLKNQGARFLTFSDLYQGRFPEPDEFGIVISFDDGFLDNYTNALPILERLNIRATLFQSTALIDASSLIWEHALYWHFRSKESAQAFTELAHTQIAASDNLHSRALLIFLREHVSVELVETLLDRAREYLNVQEELIKLAKQLYPSASHLRKAHEQGHELGSHGHRHYKRVNISDSVFKEELRQSGQVLTDILRKPPDAFSYPFNSYKPEDDFLCASFFKQAATVNQQFIQPATDALWIPRFSWPGSARNHLRQRRWLLTGQI